jgi:hypothetical protein
MKKIIFLFTVVLTIAIISAYNQNGQNIMTEKHSKPATPKDLNGISKSVTGESKSGLESFSSNKAPDEGSSKILLMLYNDTGRTEWSPCLWWNYEHAKPGQPGC